MFIFEQSGSSVEQGEAEVGVNGAIRTPLPHGPQNHRAGLSYAARGTVLRDSCAIKLIFQLCFTAFVLDKVARLLGQSSARLSWPNFSTSRAGPLGQNSTRMGPARMRTLDRLSRMASSWSKQRPSWDKRHLPGHPV